MATHLEVWNSALALLGEDPIELEPDDEAVRAPGDPTAAIDPTDDVVRTVAAIYPQVREELLNAHPWSWLTQRRRAIPAPVQAGEDIADWPYPHRWHKPELVVGNTRAVYRNNDPDTTPQVRGWKPLGVHLYTEFEPVWVEYQSIVEEPGWPQLFVNAVVMKLAAFLAVPVVFDMELQSRYMTFAELALSNAQRVDSQGHPSERIESFPFLEARIGGIGRERGL